MNLLTPTLKSIFSMVAAFCDIIVIFTAGKTRCVQLDCRRIQSPKKVDYPLIAIHCSYRHTFEKNVNQSSHYKVN